MLSHRPTTTEVGVKSDDNAQDRNTRGMARGAARTARGREGTHAAQRRTRAAAAGSCRGFASTRTIDSRLTTGSASLQDLFRGRSQLLVYHFMFGPDYRPGARPARRLRMGSTGSPSTSPTTTSRCAAVSRAPLAKLQAYKRRHGLDVSVGVVVQQRFQRRLQRRRHRAAAARRERRLQLPARATGVTDPAAMRADRRRFRRRMRNRRADIYARAPRHEHVRARRRRRLPRLFNVCARTGWSLGYVPVARPRADGSQRDQAGGGAATTSTRRLEHAVNVVVRHRTSQRAFIGAAALLFAMSAAVTIIWCRSMSTMDAMPMPGGWTMSMAWMRMPGQTWPGAAASFLGMWIVMMVAMMLPSLVPMLWRYREAVGARHAPWPADRVRWRRLLFCLDRVRNGRVSVGRCARGDLDAATRARARRPHCGGCGRSDRRRSAVHRMEGASSRVLPGRAGRGCMLRADTVRRGDKVCDSDSTVATAAPVRWRSCWSSVSWTFARWRSLARPSPSNVSRRTVTASRDSSVSSLLRWDWFLIARAAGLVGRRGKLMCYVSCSRILATSSART